MAKTVVGLFDTLDEAQDVVQELIDEGFDRKNISLVANDASGKYANYSSTATDATMDADHADGSHKTAEAAGTGAVGGTVVGGVLGLLVGVGALAIPGIGPVVAAGQLATVLGSTALGAGIGAAAGGLIGALVGAGVPEEDANYYAEGVRRGGTLVMVSADDDRAAAAYDIMQDHDAIDIKERGAEWRQGGWNGFDANAEPYQGTDATRVRTENQTPTDMAGTPAYTGSSTSTRSATTNTNRYNDQGQAALPVVEEELQVGKREVERGGVRVNTHVSEKPVEANVNLRDEHVNVERRAVNRPVTDADLNNAFQEGTIEVTETDEEAVVAKQPRVVEEVVINKEVENRNQTVRDTVRRTDVDVEKIEGDNTRYADSETRYDTNTDTRYDDRNQRS